MEGSQRSPKQLVEHWYTTIWSAWDSEGIEHIAHPDFEFQGAFGSKGRGFDPFWAYQGRVWGGFRDLKAAISEWAHEGDQATCAITWSGTHGGHIWNTEATGRQVEASCRATVTFRDGKIARVDEEMDLPSFKAQIDAPELPPLEDSKQRIFPTLRCLDWEISRRFFVEKLGFRVIFEWRHAVDFPVYAGIYRDGIHLHVSEHTGDGEPGVNLAIHWPGVDALHAELKERDVEASEPYDQPWGDRTFNVKDPSQNNITFFEATPS